MIPPTRFALAVREVAQQVKNEYWGPGNNKQDYRWERDALVALQVMTEHVLVLFMEMRYGYFALHF